MVAVDRAETVEGELVDLFRDLDLLLSFCGGCVSSFDVFLWIAVSPEKAVEAEKGVRLVKQWQWTSQRGLSAQRL